ncbi:SWIM zinc finger family protein [Glycomyces sp. NPDC049804]|uniref:SWIM zinc finger family protein n=1 Tax=Glycomyces sp. NPDC049804 TaxID=3154363 RepID=UPI003428C07A
MRLRVLADPGQTALANDFAAALDPLVRDADSGRIQRGLDMARNPGRVDDIEIEPGTAQAFVAGSSSGRYAVRIRVREFDRADRAAWDLVLGPMGFGPDVEAGRFSRDLIDCAAENGSPIVPEPDEVEADCDCPDPQWTCKHIIAVLSILVQEVDRSGAVLLRLRGIDAPDAQSAPDDPESGRTLWAKRAYEHGPTAAEAFARECGPLPEPPGTPAEPVLQCFHEHPYDPGRFTADLNADALDLQAAIAATTALLAIDLPLQPRPDDLALDAARIASGTREAIPRLAEIAGCTPPELEDRALAWIFGGETGIQTLTDQFQPDPETRKAADAILKARFGTVSRRQNRWTIAAEGLQLRLGRDGRWYPYTKEAGRWLPDGPPAADPLEAAAVGPPAPG